MNILFKGIFGSRLYSTNNEDSDTDYKSIYCPSIQDCILGTYAKNITVKTNDEKNIKNSAEDVDCETYALQEFIKLALQGQTVAVDMLATPKDKTLITSPEWEILVQNRKRFYTKRMNSFIGYSMAMASKYGSRAEKLNIFKETRDLLIKIKINNNNIIGSDSTLWDIWDQLPVDQNRKKIEVESNRLVRNKWSYEICGKKILDFASIDYAVELLDIQIDQYGNRVRQAEQTGFTDYKSLYHAFRVAYELKQILLEGDLVFPLPETDFIKKVKYGQLNFITDGLGQKLEDLLDEVGDLCHSSSLPEKPDKKWAEEFIIKCYEGQIK